VATWKTRGLRGNILEEIINKSNELYRNAGLCLVQKIATPITPVKIDPEKRQITLAFFEKKSTVDYIGAAQGIPICFDAKECASSSFSLKNVHSHQLRFMGEFQKQGGVAFIIIYFSKSGQLYYLRKRELDGFVHRMEKGGRKSFSKEELSGEYFLEDKGRLKVPVPYLIGLKQEMYERKG